MTRALVLGYGSIGARHVRVLEGLGVDVAVVSRRAVDVTRRFQTPDDALRSWAPDYVVIASRTGEHLSDLAALAAHGFAGRVLVEKPLFDAPAALPGHAFAAAYVGYNLRFHPVVRRVRALLAERAPRAVHFHVGQYLPDWRPGTDYRTSYSAHRGQGGGVLRDLSHELDLVRWLLGPWTRLAALGGHASDLEIDSDDVIALICETARCPCVTVTLNYLDRPARRSIHAVCDGSTIRADLIRGTCAVDDREEEAHQLERDATYRAQHRAALGDAPADGCTLEEGLAVVSMIAATERAMAERRWISP